MNAKNTDERQLQDEIRWVREALAIAENCDTCHEIQEAHKQQIPIQYRHLAEMAGDTTALQDHLERLSQGLENLQSGEWQ